MNAARIFGSLAIATTLLAAPAAMAGERDHHRLGVQVDVSHKGHYDRGRHHRKDDRHYRGHRREAIRHERHHRRAERRQDRRHHSYGHSYRGNQPRWHGRGYRQDRRHDRRDHGRRHHGRHHSSHNAELSVGTALIGYIAGYSRYDD